MLPTVHCQPDASQWPFPDEQVWARGQQPLPVLARRFREQLGLPIDRPIVMSGHQATLWHGGIAAKYFAASEFAAQNRGAGAWLVVDQDPEDFSSIALPVRGRDGHLAVRRWQIAPKSVAAHVRAGVPPCLIPAFDPAAAIDTLLRPGEQWASESIPAAIDRTRHVFKQARAGLSGAGTAGEQLSVAAGLMLAELCPAPLTHVLAHSMHATDLFIEYVNVMAADPVGCARSYNQAVERFPRARLTKLVCEPDKSRVELPLWHLDGATGLRKRVFAHSLKSIVPTQLAPRALLMTALVRSFACDLFIHGKGGGTTLVDEASGYDAAMEDWVAAWQGLKPCPSVVVSADLQLSLPGFGQLQPADIYHAVWLAQHARHSPGALGDSASESRKREIAESIRLIARDPAQAATRAVLYRELHTLLDVSRTINVARLAGLVADAVQLKAKASDLTIARDRTYSIAIFERGLLGELQAAVAGRLAAAVR